MIVRQLAQEGSAEVALDFYRKLAAAPDPPRRLAAHGERRLQLAILAALAGRGEEMRLWLSRVCAELDDRAGTDDTQAWRCSWPARWSEAALILERRTPAMRR